MIPKCAFIDRGKRLAFLLATFCNLLQHGYAADVSKDCRTIVIASTLGTLLVCVAVSVAIVIYVRRRVRNNVMRESRGKMVTDVDNGSLHFENELTIAKANEERDSGTEISSSSPKGDDHFEKQRSISDKNARANFTDMSTQTSECDFSKPTHQMVVLEKGQDGGIGLNLAVAGLYVKTVCSGIVLKSGCCLEPGDEILSINGRPVEGMTDMEALALLAKSGPSVLLEVNKKAFLGRVYHQRDLNQQHDVKKRARMHSPQTSTSNEAAWKRAKIEMDEALMELRRSTSHRDVHAGLVKTRENSSPSQSLCNSVEVQDPIAEEEFVIIESNAVDSQKKTVDEKTAQAPRLGGKLNERQQSCDENENIVPRTVRSRSHLGISLSKASAQVNPDDVTNKERRDSGCVDSTIVRNSSMGELSVENSVENYSRKGLSLPLSSMSYSTKKANSLGERPRSSSVITPSKSFSSSLESVNSSSNLTYCILENGKVSSPAYSSPVHQQSTSVVDYDLDKIKPPPSYEVASQIFNSQKPTTKSIDGFSENERRPNDSIESQTSYQNMLNGVSSQHSSFDEIESLLPTMITKAGREQIGIDQHVMRYMTKKYSEPRLVPSTTHSSVAVSPINAPKLTTPAVPSSIVYRRSPVAVREHSAYMQSPYDNDGQQNVDVSCVADQQLAVRNSSISLAASAILNQSLTKKEAVTSKGQKYSPQTEHISTLSFPWNSDVSTPTNGHVPKKSSDSINRSRVDLNINKVPQEEQEMLELSQANLSVNQPGSQPRKTVVASRPSRLVGQKSFNVENIRRATSSPSVNSEHQRTGSAESQGETPTGPRRARTKRNNRSTKDESFDRRKSIDSGSLRKLAAELQANQSLSDDLPMLSRLLGDAGFQELDKQNNLSRYRSSDTLYGNF